jgi:uncharacterized protein (UPF0128 family)
MCLSELLSSGQKIFISASRTYFWNAPHTTRETDNYGKTGKEHLIKKMQENHLQILKNKQTYASGLL